MSEKELQEIAVLIVAQRIRELSADEKFKIDSWIAQDDNRQAFESLTNDTLIRQEMHEDELANERILAAIKSKMNFVPEVLEGASGRRLNFRIWRWAAAAAIVFGLCAYLWIGSKSHKTEKDNIVSIVPAKDLAPGSNKATLTLSDGKVILLSDVATGLISKQGNTAVEKTKDGQIRYDALEHGTLTVAATNTISTPRGGQYEVILPDNSKVWMNSATKLVYPTEFFGQQRSVSLDGEAYFEVAKDQKRPFIVTVGTSTVQVLGTHFNIDGYHEDGIVKATLLEGSVRVATSTTSVLIVPGQQAIVNANKTDRTGNDIEIRNKINLEGVVAWKNGHFHFENSSLKDVMRDLSRWYDFDVSYEEPVSKDLFKGDIQRSLMFSQLVQILNDETNDHIHYQIDGRKITVKP